METNSKIKTMWKHILKKFNKYPAQLNVIKKMLELGLRIDEKKLYIGDVEINTVSLAKSINVDRRVITSTINTINNDEELTKIFHNLQPAGPLLTNIHKELKLGVIEIEGNAESPGILYEITKLLTNENISIRQAYAKIPDLNENPNLIIITDKPIKGDLLNKFLEIKGITKVIIT
ncbi:MAG: amino acid-binding protein [Methanobacteriaceae archaeon]|nr:amino acid-binding protein [Methanobacteriaceae archaeon]